MAAMQSRLDAAIGELGEKGEEIQRLTGELASVGAARQTLEQDLASAGRALEEARSGLAGRDQEIAGLEDKLGAALTRLTEREIVIKTLNSDLAAVRSDQEISERNLTSVTQAHSDTKALLETHRQDSLSLQERFDTLSAQLAEREQAILRLTRELETARSSQQSEEQELASATRALSEARASLEAVTRETASQKQDLARILAEKEKAEALAESLSTALKEFRDQLEQEKYRFRDTESRMNALILQRDRELGELRRVQEDARTTASSHKGILEQMRRNLDSAVSSRAELQDKLDLAEENIRRISQDLENATRGRDGDRSQISSLSDELERLKKNLEQEIVRRQEYEDQLKDALTQQQQLEQDLDRMVSESKTLHADLTAERKLHEDAKRKQTALEEQVSSLSREKLEAEKTASALSAEINQARVALADEWEDHMTDHERLLAAVEKKAAPPTPAPFSGVKKEAEIIKKRSLVVKVPGLSPEAVISSRPEIISEPAKVPEPMDPEIRSVEDLFEDDEGKGEEKPDEIPVSVVQKTAEAELEPGSDRAGTSESFFEGEAATPGLDSDEEAGEEESVTELGDETAGQPIAFDRTQWLDLLKWSHHCEALTQDQRNHIVRMGRLIQKGRRLTRKQEEQVLEMIALVQKLGYRFS
jgi:chromosome segregation ATPase